MSFFFLHIRCSADLLSHSWPSWIRSDRLAIMLLFFVSSPEIGSHSPSRHPSSWPFLSLFLMFFPDIFRNIFLLVFSTIDWSLCLSGHGSASHLISLLLKDVCVSFIRPWVKTVRSPPLPNPLWIWSILPIFLSSRSSSSSLLFLLSYCLSGISCSFHPSFFH